MIDREKIIRYYRGGEGEEIAVKLVDTAEQAIRSRKYRLSVFLDPLGQSIAETVAANNDGLGVEFFGGYAGAERQRAAFLCKDFRGTPDYRIAVVRAEWKEQYHRLSHRDVLGALMGLGIQREQLGDLLVSGGMARILAEETMAQFILQNCAMIGAANVSCTMDELSSIAPKEERCKEIRATVASMRVDAIAAAGFGFSRSRAASDIAAEKLKLNWQTVKNASHAVKEGDILSMRGRGRLEVAEVRGQTKKGRISIFLKRYL